MEHLKARGASNDYPGTVSAVRGNEGERGQTLVEYVLILALISLATIAALGFLSGRIQAVFSKSGNSLNSISVSSGPVSPPPPAPPPNGTVITNGNSSGPPTNALLATYYAGGSIQFCNPPSGANGLACLFNPNGGGTVWGSVGGAGLYFPVPGFPYASGQSCSFTWNATGYTFSGTWTTGIYRIGMSGSADFGAACL